MRSIKMRFTHLSLDVELDAFRLILLNAFNHFILMLVVEVAELFRSLTGSTFSKIRSRSLESIRAICEENEEWSVGLEKFFAEILPVLNVHGKFEVLISVLQLFQFECQRNPQSCKRSKATN